MIKLLFTVCHVIIASHAPNPSAIYWHESAHCWGWTHGAVEAPISLNYQAPTPPVFYDLLGAYPKMEVEYVTIREAKRRCHGHWGCMSK